LVLESQRLASDLVAEVAAFRAQGSRAGASQAETESIADNIVQCANVGDDALLPVFGEPLADGTVVDFEGVISVAWLSRNGQYELIGMLAALGCLSD
jgi:hypothetical protein